MHTFLDHCNLHGNNYSHLIRPCGMLVSHSSSTSILIKGKSTLVLMHSGIVNGYQLLCSAHTVPEQDK